MLPMKKRFLCLGLLGLVLVTGIFHLWWAVGPKPDALWIHYLGYRWFEPALALQADLANRLHDAYGSLEMARREFVSHNYPVAATTQYLFKDMASLPFAIGAGLYLQYLIAAGIFLFGALSLKNIAPLCLMLSVVALTGLLPGPKPTDHLLIYSGFEAVANFIALIVAPGEIFNPMSPWPKNIVLLLSVMGFALRWQGRSRLAYVLFGSSVLFHLSFGVVVLALIAGIEILRRFNARLRSVDAEFAVVALTCVACACFCLAVYIVVDPTMPWDEVTAFVQLATRLLILASLVGLLWVAVKAVDWLDLRLKGDSSNLSLAAVWTALFLMTYGAIGAGWEKIGDISDGYAALARSPTNEVEAFDIIYFHVLSDLKAQRR